MRVLRVRLSGLYQRDLYVDHRTGDGCWSDDSFYLVSWLGERVSADLRSAVFNNLVHMQPSYFESNHSGEIMSRLTTDTTLLQTLIGSSVSLACATLTLTGALTLMVITNLKLSLVILVAVPVTLIPILVFGRRVKALQPKPANDC